MASIVEIIKIILLCRKITIAPEPTVRLTSNLALNLSLSNVLLQVSLKFVNQSVCQADIREVLHNISLLLEFIT